MTTTAHSRRSCGYAALVGIGTMAAVDEIIFHQLLQWHHFFDHATPAIGIVSDGLLHAMELMALVAGFFLLIVLALQQRLIARLAWAGFFIGAGGFQLFDGVVSHKILRIHQIRYDVDLLVYDVTWIASGLVLLLIGIGLYRRHVRRA
ncbi:DUF2243 domain-containing protein [Halomonas sp. TRM85114]|uniref:DUF2243 domain-containing protein n=1 Tax=Halomonas jincaotanensis TaxID=2810616 RepID=UPI001BD300F6|nr:DUF2243 domain-containing protein [Halomonas jincaotanensis]MBS9402438.1 DUF2243 domain-containing protein [Halomonas jincaotanensis]